MSPVRRPKRSEVLVFATPEDFRDWLEQHHAAVSEAFIGYYKKGVDRKAMTYAEAVDEALCYGWIDGITYRVDDEMTTTRFTPRRKGSNWSAVNIGKVARLRAAGRMREAGLRAFEARDADTVAPYSYEQRPAELPPEYLARLAGNPGAEAYWASRSPSYRRAVTWWVMSAKREETRDRRMTQLIEDCAAERPIRAMSYGRQTVEPG
ncbi:MAG TPA: YdeI/OmpD-associated family protein [Candidatus Limnocylindria bacterium]